MPDYYIPLDPGGEYHILSRAIGSERLFTEETNYHFFLSRYKKYISPIAVLMAIALSQTTSIYY